MYTKDFIKLNKNHRLEENEKKKSTSEKINIYIYI